MSYSDPIAAGDSAGGQNRPLDGQAFIGTFVVAAKRFGFDADVGASVPTSMQPFSRTGTINLYRSDGPLPAFLFLYMSIIRESLVFPIDHR